MSGAEETQSAGKKTCSAEQSQTRHRQCVRLSLCQPSGSDGVIPPIPHWNDYKQWKSEEGRGKMKRKKDEERATRTGQIVTSPTPTLTPTPTKPPTPAPAPPHTHPHTHTHSHSHTHIPTHRPPATRVGVGHRKQ
eukprot:360750-Chlamydomonas_euryale.AAC.2